MSQLEIQIAPQWASEPPLADELASEMASDSPAMNEFAFRYLFPEQARKACWPLDKWEQVNQFDPVFISHSNTDGDFTPLAERCLFAKPSSGSTVERLIMALFQTHFPSSITPKTSYGLHGAYPSPRSYYQFKFLLHRVIDGKRSLFHVDLEHWQLCPVQLSEQDAKGIEVVDCIIVQTNFTAYNQLYNLFRKSIYALEFGHFVAAFRQMGQAYDLTLDYAVTDQRFMVKFADAVTDVEKSDRNSVEKKADIKQLMGQARKRNSGHFSYGLFPAKMQWSEALSRQIAQTARQALAQVKVDFPNLANVDIDLKACIGENQDQPAGLYQLTQSGFELVEQGVYLSKMAAAYNYQNFSFHSVPAVLFLSVPSGVFGAQDCKDFMSLNIALATVYQNLIHLLIAKDLFGRPFRSYDQSTIDQLIHKKPTTTTYYGLMIGKNRGIEALGVVK